MLSIIDMCWAHAIEARQQKWMKRKMHEVKNVKYFLKGGRVNSEYNLTYRAKHFISNSNLAHELNQI